MFPLALPVVAEVENCVIGWGGQRIKSYHTWRWSPTSSLYSHPMQNFLSWSTICTTTVADHSMALITNIITIMESKSLKADIHFSTTNVDHSTKTNQRLTKLRAKVLKLIFSMIIAIITITTKKSSPSTIRLSSPVIFSPNWEQKSQNRASTDKHRCCTCRSQAGSLNQAISRCRVRSKINFWSKCKFMTFVANGSHKEPWCEVGVVLGEGDRSTGCLHRRKMVDHHHADQNNCDHY